MVGSRWGVLRCWEPYQQAHGGVKGCYDPPMRSSNKKPLSTNRPARVARAVKAGGDSVTRKLLRQHRRLGNTAVGEKLDGATSTRDALLQNIGERLKKMRGVQIQERMEMADQRDWFRRVLKGFHGYTSPDPTRWHQSALSFKRAAEALSRGDLRRGAQLLDRALQEERDAYESLPTMVRERLQDEQTRSADTPAELSEVRSAASCPARDMPSSIDVADDILAMEDRLEEDFSYRRRRELRAARRARKAAREAEDEKKDDKDKKGEAESSAEASQSSRDKDEEEEEEEEEEERHWWDYGEEEKQE